MATRLPRRRLAGSPAGPRELPARKAGIACQVLGNTVLIQYLAQEAQVTLLEEMQAATVQARRAA